MWLVNYCFCHQPYLIKKKEELWAFCSLKIKLIKNLNKKIQEVINKIKFCLICTHDENPLTT